MKYPELEGTSFILPQLPEQPQLPKLVPIPSLPLPNTAAEEAALTELRNFQAFKSQLFASKLERVRIEKAKKDAFSKILVPQAAASDLAKAIEKRPDLSEFDTIVSSSSDLNTINNDFHLLKEIMGSVENVKITHNPSSLPLPTDMKRLGSMRSSLESSQSFLQKPQPSISSSPQSSVLSIGSSPKKQSPQRVVNTPPPIVRNISPALKQKLYTRPGGTTDKFDSLVQMGFTASNVAKALGIFSDEQEILDFLVLLQDLDQEYVNRIAAITDRSLLDKRLSDLRSLVEMGFGNNRVSQVLISTEMDKDLALEILLSE